MLIVLILMRLKDI